jgi:hypothetical protein
LEGRIASELNKTPDREERLRVLVKKWEFFLPTAAAILTILYPDEFAIFDWRVRDELNSEYKPFGCLPNIGEQCGAVSSYPPQQRPLLDRAINPARN